MLPGLALPLVTATVLPPVAFQRSGPIFIVLLLLFFAALVVFLLSVFVKGQHRARRRTRRRRGGTIPHGSVRNLAGKQRFRDRLD